MNFEDVSDDRMVIVRTCPICNIKHFINVSKEAYDSWKKGTVIQKAFPELDEDQREWIISGLCPKCFDDVMVRVEEEYNDYDDDIAF